VVVPRLGDDADRGRVGLDQLAQHIVVVGRPSRPAGRAEGDQLAGLEVQLRRRPLEELLVLGVGAGPAPLDVVDAEVVELLGDAQLVLDREREPLPLAAVTKGGVVDLDRVRSPRH
jgi:hypothetical protein